MKIVNLAVAMAALAGAAAIALTAPGHTVFNLTSLDSNGADPQSLIEPASYDANASFAGHEGGEAMDLG